MTKIISLTQNKIAIVDDDMYEYLNQWNWYVYKNNTKWRAIYYAARNEGIYPNQKVILMHRVIMSVSDSKKIDHIDHNGLNNIRKNLRLTTVENNAKHRETRNKNNTSGHRNVSWIKGDWRVQLQINGKNHLFPEKFKDVDEAGEFAEKMRLKYYKEYSGND